MALHKHMSAEILNQPHWCTAINTDMGRQSMPQAPSRAAIDMKGPCSRASSQKRAPKFAEQYARRRRGLLIRVH